MSTRGLTSTGIDSVTHVLALETPNGAIIRFHSPLPWAAGTMTPTINGRIRTYDFVSHDNTSVEFVDPPGYGDVVGFFLTPAVS